MPIRRMIDLVVDKSPLEQLMDPTFALAHLKLGDYKNQVVMELKDLALNTQFNKSPVSVANYINATLDRIFALLDEGEEKGTFTAIRSEKLGNRIIDLLMSIKERLLKALAEERKTEGLTVDDQVLLNRHLEYREIETLNDLGVEGVRGEVKRQIAKLLAILEWNESPFSIGQFAKTSWNKIRSSYKEAEKEKGGTDLDDEKQTVYRLLHTVKDRYLKVLREKRNDHGVKLRDEDGHTVVNPVRPDF